MTFLGFYASFFVAKYENEASLSLVGQPVSVDSLVVE